MADGRNETEGIGIDAVGAKREEVVVSETDRDTDEEGKALIPSAPPAASESWANPTEGGSKRKTE